MTLPFLKPKPTLDMAEIHQLTQDLERLSKLRDKSFQMWVVTHEQKWTDESDRYDRDIKTAQLVLEYLQQQALRRTKHL